MVQTNRRKTKTLGMAFPGPWIYKFRNELDVEPGGTIVISCFPNMFIQNIKCVIYLPYTHNGRYIRASYK